MFRTLSRSWHFAKMSYGVLWENKRLIVFPFFSSIAALLVTASFVLPLYASGELEQWSRLMSDESARNVDPMMYVTAFLFYFCNYFVIVFFNSALVASALRTVQGENGTVSYGISAALKRLPQIFGWALFSAVIGVLLKVIENSNEKAGRFVAAILGCAWTALTYFVVPVIVLEGAGPIGAFKSSTATLKKTWGTALVGNFSLGFLGFILAIPLIVLLFVLFPLAGMHGGVPGLVLVGCLAVVGVMVLASATSAADGIFKALLYCYATGRSLPADLDASDFSEAFRSRR